MSERVEQYKQDIINSLKEAEMSGLRKKDLGIKGSLLKKQAITELEKQDIIVNLETSKSRFLYVLKEFDNPLEMACDRIESFIISSGQKLVSRSKIKKVCEKGCPGKIKKQIDKGVDLLIKTQKIFGFKFGRYYLFIGIDAVKSILPQANDDKLSNDISDSSSLISIDNVIKAYEKIKKRVNFNYVEIYELQQELNIPMDQLKSFIKDECKQGKAVLSAGDWSLSSEETRSGAIYLHGEPQLIVRFIEGSE